MSLQSYSQSLTDIDGAGAGLLLSKISYTPEDANLRLNYFLNKEEETKPPKTYSIQIVNSSDYLNSCDCESKIARSISTSLEKSAPNLTYDVNGNADIIVSVTIQKMQRSPPQCRAVRVLTTLLKVNYTTTG